MESIDVFAPLASLQWEDRNTIHANDYNPNKVSEENLKLLIQSILTNGWTLPIVVRPDGTIIDGFHRWTVSGREPLLSLLWSKPFCIRPTADRSGPTMARSVTKRYCDGGAPH